MGANRDKSKIKRGKRYNKSIYLRTNFFTLDAIMFWFVQIYLFNVLTRGLKCET